MNPNERQQQKEAEAQPAHLNSNLIPAEARPVSRPVYVRSVSHKTWLKLRGTNVFSGAILFALSAIQLAGVLSGENWGGLFATSNWITWLLVPLWLAAAAVFALLELPNQYYLVLGGATFLAIAHGTVLLIAHDPRGNIFFFGGLVILALQGFRMHKKGTLGFRLGANPEPS